MGIMGVTHPIPKWFAVRIYNEGKTVFVGKSFLGKVTKGDKFIIYESRGAKAYTGWAEIKLIKKMKPNQIIRKFKNKLMITSNELKDYSKGMELMTVIEFENFEKFKKPVKPSRFVVIRGKYVDNQEYDFINRNKG